jgi:hypothetical protein
MKIVVYTCNLNGWDNLHAPTPEALKDSSAEYICFTNDPQAPSVPPWNYRPAYVPLKYDSYAGFASWGRTARIPKMLPHLFFEADVSIWHDANFSLTMRPEDIVERTLVEGATGEQYDLALCTHPSVRTDLYEEAQICIEQKIGDARAMERQVKEYRLKGHPEGFGLWACGFLVRRHNERTQVLNEYWWRNFSAGSNRDQIAFPFTLWETAGLQLKVNTLTDDVYRSRFTNHHWHNAFKGRGDVDSYAKPRAIVAARAEELALLVGDDTRAKPNV